MFTEEMMFMKLVCRRFLYVQTSSSSRLHATSAIPAASLYQTDSASI